MVSHRACCKISPKEKILMSDFTTNRENLNEEETTKVTIKVEVEEEVASHVLALFSAPAPPVGEIDEIHLIITRSDSA